MAITLPTDGQGVYESIAPSAGQSVWGPRLDQIAAGGFKLVLNYGLLFGSIAQITAYINYAASKNMKVIVAIHNSVIWDTVANPTSSALAAEYPTIYAAAGSPTSNWSITFGQYVVNQLKGLAGVWGWYVADEPTNAQHTQLKAYTDAIKSADNTHPRLLIAAGGSASAFANSTTTAWDCCDVGGDDYYPVGDASAYALTSAQAASGIQSYCTLKGIQSAFALQTFSWGVYGRPGQPWPSEAQMIQQRNDVLSNMTPRLILWYTYYDAIVTGSPNFAPPLQWFFTQNAATGRTGLATFPALVRRGYLR
jgi:hypothetical protein